MRAAEDVRVTRATLQDENDRATRNTMRGIQDLEGMQFFALILVFFQMMTGQPIDEDMLASLSQNFGIDQEQLTGIVRDYQSGNISSFEAASQAYGAMDRTRANLPGATHAVSAITGIDIGERQRLVAETIPEVAAELGISEDYMQGLWGYESTFGQNLMSPTGCEGDWQFSQSTWDNVMRDYGEQIAAHIEEDYPEKAAEIRANHDRAGSLNEYQYDPVVSTWASGYLNLENSRALGIDPSQESSYGMMYAAYNIGPGNAETLKAAAESGDQRAIGPRLGNVATWNPSFFTGGASGAEALERYSSVIHQREDDYERLFAQIQASEQPGYVTGANYDPNTAFTPDQLLLANPMGNNNITVTSDFGPRDLSFSRMHHGVDFRTRQISPDGRVDLEAQQPMTVVAMGYEAGFGNRLIVALGEDDKGRLITAQYAHLDSLPTHLTPGQVVQPGEYLVTTGSSGRITGPHLDYQIRVGEQTVNPELAIGTDLTDSRNGDRLIADAQRVLGSHAASGTYNAMIAPALQNRTVVNGIAQLDRIQQDAILLAQQQAAEAERLAAAAAEAEAEAAAVADISASDTAPEATIAAVSAPADTAASPQDDPLAPTDATSAVSLSEQFGPADQPQGVDQVAASAAADPPAAAPAADATASEEVVLAASSPPPAQQRASAGMAV